MESEVSLVFLIAQLLEYFPVFFGAVLSICSFTVFPAFWTSIAFGDFKNYWIADRAGRTVQRLNELYSTNGQVGFVATERVDGKVILPEGIQLLQMKSGS